MKVYVALYRWNTEESDGAEILGVFKNAEGARTAIEQPAQKIREIFSSDFWDGDMTWDEPTSIQLGHCGRNYLEQATVYSWEISEQEVE